jgi:hypothetical protein
MRARLNQNHGLKLVGLSLLVVLALPAWSAPIRAQGAQDYASKMSVAMDYISRHAEREEMVRIPMRDGIRLSALFLFPKDQPRRNLPTVLIYNPYLTEGMLQGNSVWIESFLKNGYAVAIENERGRYFSEGVYTYMGHAPDGYDTIEWIAKQPWSNSKVGLLGCSSSAEEQLKIDGLQPPSLGAAVPMGSGAGIGKVGAYDEKGNFYRGGVIQNFWYSWYYGAGYKYKPQFDTSLTREQMIRLYKYWNLEPETVKPANLDSAIWTLPINKIMSNLNAAPSDLDDFVNWLPNDPRWKPIDFGGDGDRFGAPTLLVNSWYDVSIGPNTALNEYETKNAANQTARDNQYMLIAPTLHCQESRMESEHTVVGARDMGDARFDYLGFLQRWYDHWLKGVDNGINREPKVHAYMMGEGKWHAYDTWPPKEAQPVSYYLDSDGGANSRLGNGRLTTVKPKKDGSDAFTYDPMHPVQSVGGQVCCFVVVPGGSFDQGSVETRNDVLVYTTPPLTERIDVMGPVKVSLYLSSDVKDTDLMVKLVDVYPDGTAWNLDEGAQRVRWRDGYDKPVFMEAGKVYKVDVPPLVTGNSFGVGHRIRLEVTSSSFPHFERNLNTGGNNYDEKDGVTAHNVIHHAPAYLSEIVLPVVRSGGTGGSK